MTQRALGYAGSNRDDAPHFALSVAYLLNAVSMYADEKGLELVASFTDDGTARDAMDLPGLEQALPAIEHREFDAFIIRDLGRKDGHRRAILTMERPADNGVTLHTVLEGRILSFGHSPLDASGRPGVGGHPAAEPAA